MWGGKKGNESVPGDGQSVGEGGCGGEEGDDGIQGCGGLHEGNLLVTVAHVLARDEG